MIAAMPPFRARATATAIRNRKAFDLAIELLRPVDAGDEDAIADEAIGEIVGALRQIAAPALGLNRSRIVAAMIAERERYDEAVRLLDGRGRPPSRLRAFADQLLPIFARHAHSDRRSRSDFRDFLVASSQLVTGVEPGSALANRIARDVLK